ncbi:amidohydrolase family-domain-containing protein [Zopfochytrium polystomum]|nr:amidohydrolase family-domain-containing protein [Zopfochytrium polystomum]
MSDKGARRRVARADGGANDDVDSARSPQLRSGTRAVRRGAQQRARLTDGRTAWILLAVGILFSLATILVAMQYFDLFSPRRSRGPPGSSCFVMHNATVYTVDESPGSAAAANSFVVADRRFVKVGENVHLLDEFRHCRAIDARGQTIVPGITDSHGHLMHLGYSLISADLTGAQSPAECRERLIEYLDAHPEITPASNLWIVGRGWDQTLWPTKEFPTSGDLDADRRLAAVPISLNRVDEHASWANKRAVELVRKHFPKSGKWEGVGGEIVVDPDTGEPTGVFIDDAMSILRAGIPPFTEAQSFEALRLATERMLRHGVVGMHDAGVPLEAIAFFKKAIDLGKFPIRNYAMIYCDAGDPKNPCVAGLPPHLLGYGDGKLTVRSVKLVTDGALGSWGAAMIEPYSDRPDKTGLMRIPKEEIEKLISTVVDQGYQANVHCIGDLANKLVLDSFEAIKSRWDSEQKPGRPEFRELRNRIEHAQLLRKIDIARFGRLGIIPSVQPTHATSDMSYAETRLGRQRVADGAYIWRSFLDRVVGVPHLPLSSDFPVEDLNPMPGVYAAVTRAFANGSSPAGPDRGWYTEECLSRYQSLRGFTLSAAYASFQDEEQGSIAAGKYADFVVYPKDWVREGAGSLSARELREALPVATVVGGVVEYGSLPTE